MEHLSARLIEELQGKIDGLIQYTPPGLCTDCKVWLYETATRLLALQQHTEKGHGACGCG